MIRLNRGTVALSIPARALGIWVCAVANKNAGIAFPQRPTIRKNLTCPFLSIFTFRNANGAKKRPAIRMRIAPTWIPVKSSVPSGANRPRFIRIKELPQVMARRIKRIHCFVDAKISKLSAKLIIFLPVNIQFCTFECYYIVIFLTTKRFTNEKS